MSGAFGATAAAPRFHDAHAHVVQAQQGGFLIAIEGKPELPYGLSNEAVAAQQDTGRLLFGVPYARHLGPDSDLASPIVKYHARREGYGPDWVSRDIARHERRLCLVDTLNAIDWEARSYLHLAERHPGTLFLFCHAGGYDILQFLKFARFVRNVWIDFSATQEIFGWVGDRSTFHFVTDAIGHAYAEPRIASKLVFGSDAPEFRQLAAVQELQSRVEDPTPFLTGNFERLVAAAGLA